MPLLDEFNSVCGGAINYLFWLNIIGLFPGLGIFDRFIIVDEAEFL